MRAVVEEHDNGGATTTNAHRRRDSPSYGRADSLGLPDYVELYGNTVLNNRDFGILLTQQGTRTDHPSPLGPHRTKNCYVHDNNVTMSTGVTGIIKTGAIGDEIFTSSNNRFENNHYRVSSSLVKPFVAGGLSNLETMEVLWTRRILVSLTKF